MSELSRELKGEGGCLISGSDSCPNQPITTLVKL